ncbi:BTB/POZ domain-containing protein At5g60050 [Ricinus communis]|uniref:BTB/POZ domain-containing protein At5g60050 n=1 Tax=Ricinus communis TaxID=3988 RepID=UPI00201AD6FE|nr:BTB/POZ domain-containing protein At5g60050 [Ricinus communis]XP_015582494.2 BTB/POZ domain-containing protein At5g60050 [Ricinus communis]
MAASREVSTMIKQGFISDPTLSFSPSRSITSSTATTLSRVFLNSPTNSKTLLSPPHFNNSTELTHPPPPPPTRSSHHPTLFQMMSEEQSFEQNRQKTQSKISKIVKEFDNFNNYCGFGLGDVRLTVIGRDGLKVSCDVHKRVLIEKSGFFREKLRDREKGIMHSVEISECDDVEVYLEALVLMYCDDLKKRLMGEEVTKVLAVLKVCAAITFDAGIMSCLEYLEAVPWSEDEEENIISHLSQLQLHDSANEVLQRVSCELSTSYRSDDIFLKLLNGVLQAKDDKARREMRTVISRLFKEDSSNHDNRLDISKDTLYSLCHGCLSSLILCLSEAACMNDARLDRGGLMSDIGREAENLQWIVDILIDRKAAEEFVKLWADQKELAVLHSKIPTLYRHEISKVTAQLCIAIGRGQILVPKETRFLLLSTWLEPLYADFGWIRRACKSVDKKLVEDGLGRTILTLPLLQQQAILLNWFDRFLSKGDDCPNIQRAFEVWWRRAFVRQYVDAQSNSQLQITVCDYPN